MKILVKRVVFLITPEFYTVEEYFSDGTVEIAKYTKE